MHRIHIDFETRSAGPDLKKTGLHKYFDHPSTDVWCMAWKIDRGPVRLWRPGHPWPLAINRALEAGGRIIAHNAAFERVCWNKILRGRYGLALPELTPERTECTMARAMAMALPGALDELTDLLALPVRKDGEGKGLMLRMAKPRKIQDDGTVEWWDVPERVARLMRYCAQDVLAECAVDAHVAPLDATERRAWILDQRINDRGLPVDLDNVAALQDVIRTEKKIADRRMRDVTGGEVAAATNAGALLAWVGNRLFEEISSLAKDQLLKMLDRDDLPSDVRAALEVRKEAGRASTAKLTAMENSASADGRARGLFAYCGANSGRWAGRRIQTQNMPRPDLDQSEIEIILGE